MSVAARRKLPAVRWIPCRRCGREAHAKQFKRANKALRTIRTYLGRVARDIGRKI
jgi:ribosomal protein L37E